MGVPVINIGSRQNQRERGANVIDIDYDRQEILSALQQWTKSGRPEQDWTYGGGDAGQQISDLLAKVDLRSHKTITY